MLNTGLPLYSPNLLKVIHKYVTTANPTHQKKKKLYSFKVLVR